VAGFLADNVGYGGLGSYGGGELRGAPTPRLDQLAREGLRLTQFLVEPACMPSRAALMTGQYSIRNGLSLIAIEGSPYTLPARAFTMSELFKGQGYATAIFGKWHLGSEPQSLPTAHGFDEFYGIPPAISSDAATYVDTIKLTQSIPEPPGALARGIAPTTLGRAIYRDSRLVGSDLARSARSKRFIAAVCQFSFMTC
jgi:arylsulfatase A-like enzyme